MPIVPDLSGNNPGNPDINGWDGTDDPLMAALWHEQFRTSATTAAARTVLGVGAGTGDVVASNNLSELTNFATARSNLGLIIGTNVQAYSAALAQLAALGDPGSDQLLFWDESANSYAYLTLGTNLSITGTTINAAGGGGGGGGDLLSTNNLSDVANAATARSNLGLAIGSNVQAYDTDLDTWAGLTPSANAQSLVTAANYAAMRTLLGLVIGTNVQAYDADLTTWAGISPSANAQSLVSAADYAAMRTLLGLVIGTNVQAYDADLTTWAGLTPSANAQSLVTAADYAAMRTLLGLVIGTNVQAYDADLAAIAGLTSAADRLPYFTGSAAAALATFTSFARTLLDDADAATARATLIAEKLGHLNGINTQTASYVAVLTDVGKVVEMNVASANTFTVPPNSSVAYEINARIDVLQYGAGQTTITPGSGVTIRSAGGALKTRVQYSGVSLYKRGTDEWVAMGDLTT